MNPRPEPSIQEVLAGLVERVTFHNAENGFCVLGAKGAGTGDLVTVVGHAATIAAGEWITASGDCRRLGLTTPQPEALPTALRVPFGPGGFGHSRSLISQKRFGDN